LFKCFHGNLEGNLSYYFHPIDKSIQPISSDNSCGQKDYSRGLGFLPYEDEFIYRLIRVEPFKKLLKETNLWKTRKFGDKLPTVADYTKAYNEKHNIEEAISKENILGTQFHPEKSQETGIIILSNFLRI
jgi:hypothetical protein